VADGDSLVGRRLGKFRLAAKLGQGGMGSVYCAVDTTLDRPVALKLLPGHLAADAGFRERFLREARKAAAIDHPNIVGVYEVGEVDGHVFIAMQLMPKGSLHDLLEERGGRLEPYEAARVVRDAARGLARAHRAGLIHRDIKPANILVGEEDEVRLADFGLVKDLAGADAPLTQTGAVLGTPHYMAPEQCEGRPDIDGRVDLYALGLVLYQCLSGVLPAEGSTPLQIISNRLRYDPRPLREVAPQAPPALVTIAESLLARRPEDRLGDAARLVAELDAFLAGSLGGRPTMDLGAGGGAPVVDAPGSGGVVPTHASASGPGAAGLSSGAETAWEPEVPVLPELPDDGAAASAGPRARHGRVPTRPDLTRGGAAGGGRGEPPERPPQPRKGGKGWLVCCCLLLLLGGGAAAVAVVWLLEERPWEPPPPPPSPVWSPDPGPDPWATPTPTRSPHVGDLDQWTPDPFAADTLAYPVRNDSSHSIYYLWASEPGAERWSTDLLGDAALSPGETISVPLPAGVWDMRVETADGTVSVIPAHEAHGGSSLILFDK